MLFAGWAQSSGDPWLSIAYDRLSHQVIKEAFIWFSARALLPSLRHQWLATPRCDGQVYYSSGVSGGWGPQWCDNGALAGPSHIIDRFTHTSTSHLTRITLQWKTIQTWEDTDTDIRCAALMSQRCHIYTVRTNSELCSLIDHQRHRTRCLTSKIALKWR